MSKKLYVGNLPYSTNQETLTDLFSKIGNVESATIITDKFSGRSKGFGFVEMPDEEALKAVEALNGSEFEGRNIVVNEARPKEEFSGNRGGSRGGFGGSSRGGSFGDQQRERRY